MMPLFKLLGVAIALFASTNIDDAFMLVGFFSNPAYRALEVVAGQYAGIAILAGASVAASLLSLLISHAYLGLLGLFPIALGCKRLLELWLQPDAGEEASRQNSLRKGHGRAATVALVTLANGADNVGVYTPVFAVHERNEVAVIVLVFALMTGAWCLLAHWLVNHPRLGAPIRRYGHILAPLALIGLGVMVLYQSGSWALLGR